MADTVLTPGCDAGVVRVHGRGKALAFTSDVTPRYAEADPEGRQAGGGRGLAQPDRHRARPLAITDNLNWQPERPEIMGQFVGCIKGIGAACTALDISDRLRQRLPLQRDERRAILPTPTIGGVGLIRSARRPDPVASSRRRRIMLIGEHAGISGSRRYLREIFGREEGDAPPVDLAASGRQGDFVRGLIARGLICRHDLSDGGLAWLGGDGAGGQRSASRIAERDLNATRGSSARTRARYCPDRRRVTLMARPCGGAVRMQAARRRRRSARRADDGYDRGAMAIA